MAIALSRDMMSVPDLKVLSFPDDGSLAAGVAGLWLNDVATVRNDRSYCVALSGGRIARRFFSAIVEEVRQRRVSLRAVHFFWADERCVPPTDPESNYALAQETLLAPLGIDVTHVHRLRGEVDPELAAREAEAALRRFAPLNDIAQPVLDIAFLGMGEDGHIASLFPGETEAHGDTSRVYRPVIGPKPPPRRLTLGYAALAAALKVWVLVAGAGKEEALKASLTTPSSTPLGRLIAMRQHTRVFTDLTLGR